MKYWGEDQLSWLAESDCMRQGLLTREGLSERIAGFFRGLVLSAKNK